MQITLVCDEWTCRPIRLWLLCLQIFAPQYPQAKIVSPPHSYTMLDVLTVLECHLARDEVLSRPNFQGMLPMTMTE